MQGHNKAFFIVIDGIDGTGKSTQVAKLTEWMNGCGHPAVKTFEPGATPAGAKIREILVNKEMSLSPVTEMLLFCADRSEHQEKVLKFLDEGRSVVCDRFLSSTWAYQIFGRKCDSKVLQTVAPLTIKRLPDLTIILDLDADTAVERAKARLIREGKLVSEGRFEAENIDFFIRVRDGFLWYAEASQHGNTVVIDASGSVEDVFAIIQKVCQEYLGIC